MSTVILSAASPALPSLEVLHALLLTELRHAGETDIRTFDLATTKLAYCQGEFDCWVRTPGVCRAHDAEDVIVQAIHDADNVVMLDAVTFGGHSYTLKRAQDRLICLLSPFFEKRAGLTHHDARYGHTASFFALGWMPVADPEASFTWHTLADANALNMLAPRVGAALLEDASRPGWAAAIRWMLASADVPGTELTSRAPLRTELLDVATGAVQPPDLAPPRKVAFVVGSAKAKGTSTSESLARALGARLEKEGLATETHFVTEFLHDGERATATARAVADADLFVLATPLYVDSLPALATRALECIAAARGTQSARARFAAIINCGFPEPEHNRTALRIARNFAVSAGYAWAGGLPLGGGGALKPGVPLDEQHGPAEHVRRALDLAAQSLARGEPISEAALELMVNAPMPDAVYRLMGDMGWRYQAHKNGLAQASLRARPLG